MSVYLGYDTITKQYLKSLAGSGASSGGGSSGSTGVDTKGFTMSGNINMVGNKIIGLDSPHSGSSAVNKQYVDDNFLSSTGDVDMSGNEIKGLSVRKTLSSIISTQQQIFTRRKARLIESFSKRRAQRALT